MAVPFEKGEIRRMKNRKKILFHMVFIAAFIIAAMGFSGAADVSYAAVNDNADGVYFEQPYAEAGSALTVKYDGTESNLTYKWFVDGEAAAPAADGSFAVTEDHYEKTVSAEVWAGESKLGEASMFCSKLPVLYIDIENGAEVVVKDDYLNAQMHLQGNDLYASSKQLYTGELEIKGRGNSTWQLFPKKPYKLKLDKKSDLFGLGKNKHWVLLANYIDESGMRNMLAGDFATRMGVGAMDGTWVEVIINGDPRGMYQLCEHVRLSEDRVDVFDWESAAEDLAEAIATANGFSEDDMDALTDQMAEEDMSWISDGEVTFGGKTYKTADYYEDLPESFSGGYLLEMDYGYDEVSKFTTTNGAPIMFKSPEFINTDETAMQTVQDYIQTFEDALYSKDFNTASGDSVVSYTELCDIESMASFWLASEFLMNEIGCKSTYFQKDIDEPLEFGPVWDFDFSSGGVSPFSAQNPTDWTSDNRYWGATTEKWWFNRAMRDPYFAVKARSIYLEQEEYLNDIIADGGMLDEWRDYLAESGRYNYELWQYADGFDADYEALDAWLTKRITWMDKQFATNASAIKSLAPGVTYSSKFTLGLQGENVKSTGTDSYAAPVGSSSFNLDVTVKSGEFTEFNYYINSKFQGTAPLENGKASIVIREDQLTEDVNADNVITVWLKDADGNLAEQRYMIVKLTSDKDFCNVVFNAEGGTYSSKVLSGKKVYLDYPLNQPADYVFEGWNDGNKTYKAGEWMAVSGDVTLNAVWTPCTDGSNVHKLQADGEVANCTAEGCTASKASGINEIDVRACILTVSNRYSNYYTGKEIKPVITLTYGDDLVLGEEYTVEYKNNINEGYATYTVKAVKGSGFKGEYTLSFLILPQEISKTKIKTAGYGLLTDGAAKPAVTVTYRGKTLVEGTDYELEYSNNTAPGQGIVVIKGKGNFTGSVTEPFNVYDSLTGISKCTVASLGTKAYTGKAVKPAVTVKDGKTKLTAGTHYKVTYSNNIKCGTATVKITGVEAEGYTGTKKVTFKIRPAKVTAKVTNVKYNQQKVTWKKVTGATSYKVYRSTTGKSGSFKLVKTVKASADRVYNSKNLKPGKMYYYKVKAVRAQKVNGKTTNYNGIEAAAVKLKPVLYKGSIKSLKNTSSKAATIKWAGTNGAHGYKIYRSATGKSGSFKLVKTTKLVKTYTDKNLKKGKTYYYKVRAYRNVDGKVVYGAYSDAKAVKIVK